MPVRVLAGQCVPMSTLAFRCLQREGKRLQDRLRPWSLYLLEDQRLGVYRHRELVAWIGWQPSGWTVCWRLGLIQTAWFERKDLASLRRLCAWLRLQPLQPWRGLLCSNPSSIAVATATKSIPA